MGSCVVVLLVSVADGCSLRRGLCRVRVAYGFSVWRQSLSAQVPASENREEAEDGDGLPEQCMNEPSSSKYERARHGVALWQCRHCEQTAFPA